MNTNNLFNKKLDITLENGKNIHIERKKVLIHESPIRYGEYMIGKNDNNVYVIREIYSFEDKRLRYSYDKYENVKCYETIEKNENGQESSIFVIEAFSKKTTLIGSLGDIKHINSDINNKEKSNEKSLIKLLKFKKKDNSNELAA